MRILVLGRSGQLARSLAERCSTTRYDWTFAGRESVSFEDVENLESLLESTDWRAIVNAAAYTQVDQAEDDQARAFAVNAEAPAILAGIAAKKNVPLIHISTDYVFDGEGNRPYLETDIAEPKSIYGQSKLAGERAIASIWARHVILRTAWVYSPFGTNFVKTMLRLADRDELGVVNDQLGNPTNALDLADAVLKVLSVHLDDPESAPAGIFHCAGSGEATWADLANEIFAIRYGLTGEKVPVVNKISSDEYPTRARRPANSRLNCALLDAEFGVKMPDWRQSVQACVKRLVNGPASKEELA